MIKRNVAILIFEDVEILDFCGPYEVFSVADRSAEENVFNVYTVSENGRSILTKNGLKVEPAYSILNCPPPDILIVPGGQGTRIEMNNQVLLDWITKCEKECQLLISVCTGAFLLANCGFLSGIKATTHHLSYDVLQELEPKCEVIKGKRYIHSGDIITSGGIAAGIDLSLYVVAMICGEETAKRTKKIMEYDWNYEY